MHWYPSSGLSQQDRVLISAFRIRSQRILLQALVRTGPLRFSDLERESGLSPRCMSRHLRLLMQGGLVSLGNNRTYRLTDSAWIVWQIDRFRVRFPDLLADAARDIFDDV